MKFYYKCSECGKEYDIKPELMLCPYCQSKQEKDKPLRGILEVELEGEPGEEFLKRGFRVVDFLPVEEEYLPDIPVGSTPLWKPTILREQLGYPNLFIKDDTCNPTGSLKDRASYLVCGFAIKYAIRDIVVASTGNAASSMAGVGASAGLSVTIFIPGSAPTPKIAQALQYGAEIILVDGDYDRAYDISLEYSIRKNALSRNTAYNPLTIEGKKTVSLEIFLSLGRIPDVVFLPAGDGVILGGVYKGFRDLKRLGITKNIPLIYAVQAEGSSAICRALVKGDFESSITAATVADSICVSVPRNGYYALKQLRDYKGKCITVSDEEILAAQRELSSRTGLFTEPAGAASYAGFLKVRNELSKDATIVLLATGNGLKDIESALKGLQLPQKTITSLEDLLG
ncbi:pyridoxal-phosphate dependent enzyme [candidate division WOR-3 bacterium]|nr:pyridoxal-phosphate dependent enzyme [candidate division WOR-3 bacterium]MCK4526919.1 pyridoxal-phosphate dependent enzyme [candidate division WOR-3 bacterium]